MGIFDAPPRLHAAGDSRFTGRVDPSWNIGTNPNGGYLLSLAVAALRQAAPQHPDPLSVTVHYLRPGLADQPCTVDAHVVRSGRTLPTGRATLTQEGGARIEVLAALGALSVSAASGAASPPGLAIPAPDMPPPDRCVARPGDEQGVGAGADLVLLPATMDRVELQQVGLTGGVALDLVDVDDVILRAAPAGAKTQLAHAAEAVDTNTNSHDAHLL